MYDIFLSTEYLGFFNLVLEFFGLLILSALVLWLFLFLSFNKGKESKLSIKVRLKLNILVGITVLMVFLVFYFVALYFLNGAHNFQWNDFSLSINTYVRLLPQIALFITLISVFYFQYSKISNFLKN